MPNYCSNTLKIVGTKETLEKVYKDIFVIADLTEEQKENRDPSSIYTPGSIEFGKLIPVPENLDDKVTGGWFSITEFLWGQKWSGSDTDVSLTPVRYDEPEGYHTIHAIFDTAWAPALAFYKHLSEIYPDVIVDVVYDEGGMDFSGHVIYRGGKTLLNDERDSIYKYIDNDDDTDEIDQESVSEDGEYVEQHQDYWFEESMLSEMLEDDFKKDYLSCED